MLTPLRGWGLLNLKTMLKKLLKFSTIAATAMALHTQAQTQVHPLTGATVTGSIVTSIQEVQTIIGSRLALCDDKSPFLNMTVTVRGRMVAPGKITFPEQTISGVIYPQTTVNNSVGQGGQEIYLQQGNVAGLFLRATVSSKNYGGTVDLVNLPAGDSIEVTGKITEFFGMTQLEPNLVTRIGVAPNLPPLIDNSKVEGISPVTITNLGNFSNSSILNNLEGGEPFEGMYVELRDLTVVELEYFPNPPVRLNIYVQDLLGNKAVISDRFRIARLPINDGQGRFQLPVVGQKYKSIKGLIYHSKSQSATNGCTSASGEFSTNRSATYQIHPWYPSQYEIDFNVPPTISNSEVSPIVPSTSGSITVSANIVPQATFLVTSAGLYFSTDTLNYDSWTRVAMTATGNQYSATIPNTFTDGQMVYYYIAATDNRNFISVTPSVPSTISGIKGNAKPSIFVVRNGGLQIRDVQFTPFANGRSPYESKVVTLTGIVTASVKDMQQNMSNVVIQQENATEWAGLLLQTNSLLSNAAMGSKITVQGRITEITAGASTFTSMDQITSVVANGTGLITPLTLSVNTFSGAYNFRNHEKYEGMLVKLVNPTANGNLFVVDPNADSDPVFTSNTQGEYRIGTDTMTIKNLATTLSGAARNTLIAGTRVLAGRNSSVGSPNSQYVSLISRQTTATGSAQQSTVEANTGITSVIASLKVSFKSMTGIAQHSFGNMKVLPRNNADIELLSVGGVSRSLTSIATPTAPIVASIYPNPTTGVFTVAIANSANSLIEISNIQGQLVYSEKTNASQLNLDLSSKNAGVYFVKITNTSTGFAYFTKLVIR